MERLRISETQAEGYADAMAELGKHYPGVKIAPKTMAWVNFLTVVAAIHIPMAKGIAADLKAQKVAAGATLRPGKAAQAPATTAAPAPTPIRPNGSPIINASPSSIDDRPAASEGPFGTD